MKKFLLALAIMITLSGHALADENYYSGYNAGYYGTTLQQRPTNETNSYGRGYGDGYYDSDRDERQYRQRSEDFEQALADEAYRDTHREEK